MIDRAKYLERQRRYNHSEKGRARWRSYKERHPQVSMFGYKFRFCVTKYLPDKKRKVTITFDNPE